MAKKQKNKTDKSMGQQNKKENASTNSSFPPSLLSYEKKKRKLQVSALVPSAVFVAKNFMDHNECTSWIKYAEELGFENLCSPQTREYAQRECGRISKNDWDMADKLYQRMKPIAEEIAKQVLISHSDETYAPLTCNGNLRLYRYNKNMSFGRHFDGSDRIAKFHGANTEITVLIYLSSCKGGATRFHLPTSSSSKRNSSGKKKAKEQNYDGIAFEPEEGSILLHIHGDRCLEHEADPVIDGVKYVLRTDIVYAPKQP